MANRRPDKVITDPKAIRALANPARLLVLSELVVGRTLTATELGELAGLTPSAMSYHLRALERFGLIERAPSVEDGRERPWRRAAGGLRIESTQPAVTAPAEAAMVDGFLERERRNALAFISAAETGPWSDAGTFSSSVRWLTPTQVSALVEVLRAAIDRYPAEDPGTPGTRAVSITQTVFPLVQSNETSA